MRLADQRLKVGDLINKVGGYAFEGVVVSAFTTLRGEERIVAELTTSNGLGMLHVFSPEQLIRRNAHEQLSEPAEVRDQVEKTIADVAARNDAVLSPGFAELVVQIAEEIDVVPRHGEVEQAAIWFRYGQRSTVAEARSLLAEARSLVADAREVVDLCKSERRAEAAAAEALALVREVAGVDPLATIPQVVLRWRAFWSRAQALVGAGQK